jgi:hypothetical protein
VIVGLRNGDGQPEQAARLLGAAEALREAFRSSLTGIFRVKLRRVMSATLATLAEPVFVAARSAGREMSLEAAVAFALRAVLNAVP